MLKVTYRPKTGAKLRMLFNLTDGGLSIAGQIYERDDPGTKDRFYWSFCGMFSWKLEDGFPPFRYEHEGHDLSFDLFFGVPQLVLLTQFDYVPKAASKYQIDNNRNCGNCTYARFQRPVWEEYRDRPTSERTEQAPRSFFACALTGERIDDLQREERSRGSALLDRARFTLRDNGCPAHTRAAYPVEADAAARERHHLPEGTLERWIPAEHRRQAALNPAAIRLVKPGLAEVAGVTIQYAKAQL